MANRPPMFTIKRAVVDEQPWFIKDKDGVRTKQQGGIIRSQAAIYEYEVDGEPMRTPTRIGLGDELPAYQPGQYMMDGSTLVPGQYGLEIARSGFRLVPVGK